MTSHYDPDASPAERWAIFSAHPHYHKIIGNLNLKFNDSLGYEKLATYITKHHSLSISILDKVNLMALQA
jgi:hypothetical protein